MSFTPYGKQSITTQDIESVINVLKSDWLTQGPVIEAFEKSIAEYCGVKYAVAVSSATAALHIACMAANLKSGDIVWTTPNTFVASANCALYCGADVDFVDIDNKTYNISIDELEQKLAKAKKKDKLPKAIIPVHFAGQSCEMERIAELSKHYGFIVLEDASHAIGGSYKNRKIGSCYFSDMTVFSFHPVKIITTGEGGMVLTNQEELYNKLIRLRTHGITRDYDFMNEYHGPWYYQQIELGYNYRITDIQAALGLSQLKRLDEFVERRHMLAERYTKYLKELPLVLPWQHPDNYSAFHLYVIRLISNKISKSRREIFEELRSAGIGVNVHYIPVHTQPYYQKLGFQWGDYPQAEEYYSEALTLPLYYDLTIDEQDYVIKTIKEVIT
ncbi:UDP-4-amino-4,6-dideoxy-N-acetyl-beta-L-altrosamine transaminase [Peptococcaceae bacterium 1198_IL3148]